MQLTNCQGTHIHLKRDVLVFSTGREKTECLNADEEFTTELKRSHLVPPAKCFERFKVTIPITTSL